MRPAVRQSLSPFRRAGPPRGVTQAAALMSGFKGWGVAFRPALRVGGEKQWSRARQETGNVSTGRDEGERDCGAMPVLSVLTSGRNYEAGAQSESLRERSFSSPRGRSAVTGATPIGFARSSEQASLAVVAGKLPFFGEHLLDLAAVSAANPELVPWSGQRRPEAERRTRRPAAKAAAGFVVLRCRVLPAVSICRRRNAVV